MQLWRNLSVLRCSTTICTFLFLFVSLCASSAIWQLGSENINDLPKNVNFFTLLFADDTTFQMTSSNLTELFAMANTELSRATDWFQANKLTLNVSKTKFILFRSKNMKVDFSNLALKIGSEKIERIWSDCKTKYFKFVGHHLDEFLSWTHQINHVHSKLSSANYAIARVKNFVPLRVRRTLYNSLFRSHMEFGILSWGGIGSGKLHKILQLQKKCTDPMFSKLNILKLQDIFLLNSLLFVHKLNNEMLLVSFDNFLTLLRNPNRSNGYELIKLKKWLLGQIPHILSSKNMEWTKIYPKTWSFS